MLKGPGQDHLSFIGTDGKEESVTVEEIRQAYSEWKEDILFFRDWEQGVVTVTLEDYRRLPDPTKKAYRLFQGIKRDADQA